MAGARSAALARLQEQVGSQQRAVGSQLLERTLLVLRRESAGDDPLLGRDARRDHLRDGFVELARSVRGIGLLVLVRPDLAAVGDVDETHAHLLAAVDLAEAPAHHEVCAAARGPVRVLASAAEDDVHVLVTAELGRELLAEEGGRLRSARRLSKPRTTTTGQSSRSCCRPRVGGRMPDRPLGGRRPSQDRDVAAPGQLDPHGVVAAREQVVALERAPQAHRLDADDRVEARVEIVRAA